MTRWWRLRLWMPLGCVGFLALLATIPRLKGQTNPVPVITATLTNNTLLLSITNTVTNSDIFEIYTTNNLAAGGGSWQFLTNGTAGQTNFLVPIWPAFLGFYRASISDDWDRDGIPNIRDAAPLNTNIGVLTVTILTPTNASNIH